MDERYIWKFKKEPWDIFRFLERLTNEQIEAIKIAIEKFIGSLIKVDEDSFDES